MFYPRLQLLHVGAQAHLLSHLLHLMSSFIAPLFRIRFKYRNQDLVFERNTLDSQNPRAETLKEGYNSHRLLTVQFSIQSQQQPEPTIRKTLMSESSQTPPFDRPRSVIKKFLAKHQQEGDGAVVRRCIGRYSCISFGFSF